MQPVFLGRFNRGVAQALAVVACHQPLQGREKRLDELLLLVVQVLANAFGHRHRGALEFQHRQRDAVHIQHHIRALGDRLGLLGAVAQVGIAQAPLQQGDPRWPPKFPRLWPPQTPPPELIGDRG